MDKKKKNPVCLFIIISLNAFDVALMFFLHFVFLLISLSQYLNCPVRDDQSIQTWHTFKEQQHWEDLNGQNLNGQPLHLNVMEVEVEVVPLLAHVWRDVGEVEEVLDAEVPQLHHQDVNGLGVARDQDGRCPEVNVDRDTQILGLDVLHLETAGCCVSHIKKGGVGGGGMGRGGLFLLVTVTNTTLMEKGGKH